MKISWITMLIAFAIMYSVSFGSRLAEAATGSTLFVIQQLYNQWSSDIVHILPVSPHTIVNPSSCPYAGQYALDSAVAGHKERVSLALGGFLNNKPVTVVVEGCSSDGRPKVISISVNN